MGNRRDRPMLAPGATILRPGHFGPTRRPPDRGAVEVCVCGIQFTRYKTHRQTTHHQRHIRADRHTARAARAAARVERMTDTAVAA